MPSKKSTKKKSVKKVQPKQKFYHSITNHVKEYTYKTSQIYIYPQSSGGYSAKMILPGSGHDFHKLVNLILDRYTYQYFIFQTRNLGSEQTDILKKIGFVSHSNSFVYQEKPKLGYWVLIAIKPYVGDYAQGYVKRILTGNGFHPRGFKVMLNDESETVGRLATIA